MACLVILLLLVSAGSAVAQDPGKAPPAQAKRGQALFVDAANDSHCGTCHALGGVGSAVGPDLSRLARVNPKGIVMAILATRTQYVLTVKLKDGSTFPGMKVAEDEKTAQYYDLSSKPPALRKLDRAEIASALDNATWKHPPESTGYSAEELADIISFIRWASFGDTRGVDPKSLE
jgi:mono/diheme cytochrome c family protein